MFVTKTRATAFVFRLSQVTWRLFTPQEQFLPFLEKTIIPFVTNIVTFQLQIVPTPSSQDEEIKEDMLHPF